jgi:hypothetical protein
VESTYGPTTYESNVGYVDAMNIQKGHRKSFVENPSPDKYPNISVMAYQGRPVTLDLVDQVTNFNITLDIETMVKGDSEAEVDMRGHRFVEAIHQVFVRNESLNGASYGWENEPVVQITDIFKRRENTGDGQNSFGLRQEFDII